MKKQLLLLLIGFTITSLSFAYPIKIQNNSGKKVVVILVVTPIKKLHVTHKNSHDSSITEIHSADCYKHVLVAYEDKDTPPIKSTIAYKDYLEKSIGGKLLLDQEFSRVCLGRGVIINNDLTITMKELYAWTKFP